jgi:DNA-binding beta-propeller fold protein YncE
MRRRPLWGAAAAGAGALLTVLLIPVTALAGPPPSDQDTNPAFVVPPLHQFGRYGSGIGEMLEPSGLAVDSADRVYVADCGEGRVQVFAVDGTLLRVIGHHGTDDGGLLCPRGLAVTPDSRLLVTDAAARRVVSFSLDGTFQRTLVDDQEMQEPYAVAVRGTTLAVTDPGTETVRVYDTSSHLRRVCGTAGDAPGQFANPAGVVFDDRGGLLVSDQENARIQSLRLDCSVEGVWGSYGGLPGHFAEPANLALVGGHLYVADLTNHRIQVLDENGNYLFEWGRHPATPHQGNGRLHYPEFVAVDPAGQRAAVCEPFEVRCQVFDTAAVAHQARGASDPAFWYKFPRFHYGKKVNSIVLCAHPCADGQVVSPAAFQAAGLPASYATTGFRGVAISEPDLSVVVVLDWTGATPRVLSRIGGYGTEPGRFRQPTGIAFDPQRGELYVSDGNGQRIEVFHLDGTLVRMFGTYGTEPGRMDGPGGLAFDSEGNLWVTQTDANRIDVFTPQGGYLRSVGSPGRGEVQFNKPLAIRYNPRLQRFYVTDNFNHRIQVLAPDGRFITSFGSDGTGPGQFIDLFDVAFDRSNDLYASDDAQNRIAKFDPDGHFLQQWGSFGSEPGQFYKPKGLAVVDDRLLVIDFGNHRGQVFTLTGRPLGVFGEGILAETAPGANTAILASLTSGAETPATGRDPGPPRLLVVAAAATAVAGIFFCGFRLGRARSGRTTA